MKKRLFSILLTALMIITSATSVVFGKGEYIIDGGGPIAPEGLSGSVSTILGVMQWIGFVVGIGMVIYIGVKYLTAGAGGKAEVKSTMVPWLVGAACVALAPTIASAIFSMFQDAQ